MDIARHDFYLAYTDWFNLIPFRNVLETFRQIEKPDAPPITIRETTDISDIKAGEADALFVYHHINSSYNPPKGWNHIEEVELYVKSFCKQAVVLGKDGSTVFILENDAWRRSINVQIRIAATAPVWLKRIFDDPPQKGSESWKLVEAIENFDETKIKQMFIKWSQSQRDSYYAEAMKKVFSSTLSRREKALLAMINSAHEVIEAHEKVISDKYKEVQDLNLRITGLKTVGIEHEAEQTTRLMRDIGVKIVGNVGDNIYIFRAQGYADNYDIEAAKNTIGNARAGIYNNFLPSEKNTAKKVFKAVFIDRLYKLKIYSHTRVDIDDIHICAERDIDVVSFDGYMANPHLRGFSCYGGYKNDIEAALCAFNFAEFVEILQASVRNLNFGDSTVMEHFGKYIRGNKDAKIFVDKKTKEEVSFNDIASRCAADQV